MPRIPIGAGEFAEIDEYVSSIRELIASMINEVNFVLVSEHLDGSHFFEKVAIGDEFLTRHGIYSTCSFWYRERHSNQGKRELLES